MPNIPAYSNPLERFAAVLVRSPKSRSGRIGSAARDSTCTNVASSDAPTTKEPRVTGDPHPELAASTRPNTTETIPSVEVSAPARSKRPWRRGVSTRTLRPRTRTASPIGTFTNITHRHETSSVRMPPATSPTAPPAAETVVKRPIARMRAGPSENTVVSNASAEGAARAAPTPWRARAASSCQEVAATPPRSELTVGR